MANVSGTRRFFVCLMAVSILFVMVASVSLAQLPTATILGVVKDSTGAVAPGAALTARNTDTGQTRRAEAGSDGSYHFAALPVGNYEVRAEHAGFRAEVRSGLTLTVSQEAVVNFTLEVGAIEQTVAVTAEAPLVNTTSGALGSLVTEDRIADLPLNGRNYSDLTLLQPGINNSMNKAAGGPSIGLNFSSNGATLYSNNYLLDGASMVTFWGTGPASAAGNALGLDGIREYRVVTNSSSAEYGMSMGSQLLIVTKSGTNAFHGSLFEYLRNNDLDARNYFDYTTVTTPGRLPPFKRNNFGGSFGGPIKKDKTFFFATYEGLRQRQGQSNVIPVIPASAKVNGGAGGVAQISPLVQPYLPYFPDPNLPNNQYTFPFTAPTTENYGQIRLDHTFSVNDTMFGRYTVDDGQLGYLTGWPGFSANRLTRQQYLTLSENHVFSPSLLNTFRASLSRTTSTQAVVAPDALSGPLAFVPGQLTGQINIGGIQGGWGPNTSTPQLVKQNVFTYSDDLYYTKGKHSLKFGALINHYQQYLLAAGAGYRGQVSFANVTSFLLAQPSSYNATTPGAILDHTYHFTTLGFYVQDDVRVLSNLTLNLGLRYEFNTTFTDTHNATASLRDVVHDATSTIGAPFANPSLRNFSPRFGFAWDVMGNGKMAVRGGFGLLYDILSNLGSVLNSTCVPPICSSSTFTVPAGSGTLLTLPLTFPASAAGKSVNELDYHLQQPHILTYNLTVERQLPASMALTVAYAGSRGLNLLQTADGIPTVPQVLPNGQKFWTGTEPRPNLNWGVITLHPASGDSWYNALQVGLQKRLSKGLQFQTSYTWSRLFDTPEGLNGGSDTLNSIQSLADASNEKLDRAPAPFDVTQNLRFNAIYRIPDVAHNGGVIAKLVNGWGASGILTDQTGYPFSPGITVNRSRSKVLGGGAEQVRVVSSDRPDQVSGRNVSNMSNGTTAGCPGVAAGQKLGTQTLWFDPCAYSLQPVGFLGNAARDSGRGPGIFTVDFSLTKDTALRFLGEGGKLEFRADFFNLLNKANFGPPGLGSSAGNNTGAAIFSGSSLAGSPPESVLATAGRLTNTSTPSRQVQLSLRLVF